MHFFLYVRVFSAVTLLLRSIRQLYFSCLFLFRFYLVYTFSLIRICSISQLRLILLLLFSLVSTRVRGRVGGICRWASAQPAQSTKRFSFVLNAGCEHDCIATLLWRWFRLHIVCARIFSLLFLLAFDCLLFGLTIHTDKVSLYRTQLNSNNNNHARKLRSFLDDDVAVNPFNESASVKWAIFALCCHHTLWSKQIARQTKTDFASWDHRVHKYLQHRPQEVQGQHYDTRITVPHNKCNPNEIEWKLRSH